MCIGIPMKVMELEEGFAWCDSQEGRRRIDIRLVGDVVPGTWVLTFMDAAREILSDENAQQIQDALAALGKAMNGDALLDHLFADLVDREPPLPDFLTDSRTTSNAGD